MSHCLLGPLFLRQGDESETVVSKVKDIKEVYNFMLQLCSTSSLRLLYSTETVSGNQEPLNPETGGRVWDFVSKVRVYWGIKKLTVHPYSVSSPHLLTLTGTVSVRKGLSSLRQGDVCGTLVSEVRSCLERLKSQCLLCSVSSPPHLVASSSETVSDKQKPLFPETGGRETGPLVLRQGDVSGTLSPR